MARSRNRVIDRDRGWKELKKRLPKAKGAHVKIGIQSKEGREKKEGVEGTGAPTLVQVAWWNEFGTFTADGQEHVPERSYIRSTHDKELRTVTAKMKKFMRQILQRKMTVRRALSLVGQYMESKIKQKIVDIRKPPNDPATIARKGSSNPLVDVGQLHQGIRYEVNMKRLGAKKR